MRHRLLSAVAHTALFGLAAIAAASPALAEGAPAELVVGGSISTHLQLEHDKAQDSKASNTLYDDTDLTGYANWSDWLTVNADVKLERQRNDNLDSYYNQPGAKGNAFMRSEGVTLRQLNATVRPVEGVSVYGGKYHPLFGSAWESMPGQFYSFASDYEQDERVGAGVALNMPEGLGDAKLSLETFFLDNSALSNSIFSRPGYDDSGINRAKRYRLSDGGASNTGNLESYTVAWRGGSLPGGIEGVKYQLSYTHEAVHLPGEAAENGYSVGVSYDPTGDGIPLTRRLGVTPFAEFTHFNNYSGTDGLNRDYVLTGLNFIYGHWNMAVTSGLRYSSNDKVAAADQDLSWQGSVATNEVSAFDHQENLTVTYEVIEHLQIGAGVNHVRVNDRSSIGWGPSMNYSLAF
ncbi:MAG TPA: hypothetical protein VM661_17370 [Candidatus Sulfotelmatobacter sp.]|jgi:hypothetical protein|nr:hypothetical protein [Candidatus Sulfotelmatobacter sp.]